MLQKRYRSGVQIHTYFVYTIFYDTFQCFSQTFLVHVVLILTNTDRFRIYFYQFCQRILQTSCNRCGTSLSHVKVREFFCCKFTCRIYTCSGFIHDHILYWNRKFFEQFHDHLFRLSGSSSVSNGDQCNMVFCDQFLQNSFGFCHFILWRSREDYHRIQHFAGGIYHS